jgi:hypothetical protein
MGLAPVSGWKFPFFVPKKRCVSAYLASMEMNEEEAAKEVACPPYPLNFHVYICVCVCVI